MLRLLIMLSIYTTLFFANEVKFNETKYINAIDLEVSKNGTLVFDKEFTKLSYSNENNSYLFQEENIVQTINNENTILTYEDNLELTIFSTLINAIYKNDLEKLKEYFTVQKNKELVTLTPDEYISNVIDKIEYKKTAKNLDFLKIYFTNEDRIEIVETK